MCHHHDNDKPYIHMNSLTMRCLRAYNRAENTFTLPTYIILYVYKVWTEVDACIMYAP